MEDQDLDPKLQMWIRNWGFIVDLELGFIVDPEFGFLVDPELGFILDPELGCY